MSFLDLLKTGASFIPGVGPLISAGLDVAGGVIGAKAAGKASDAQQQAVTGAVDETRQSGAQSQALGRQYLNDVQYNNQAYQQSGQAAAGQIQGMTGPGGELDSYRPDTLNPAQNTGQLPTFKFDPSQVQTDPGYAFRMEQGNKALLAGRAAHGVLGSGATDKALVNYNQDAASQEYQNAYGRSYQQQSDAFKSQQEQSLNTEDVFNQNRAANTDAFKTNQAAIAQNQTDRFNRLATQQQLGQSAASDTNSAVKTFGTQAAGNVAATGAGVADLMTQGGNAKASGIVGKANATTGALGNVSEAIPGIMTGVTDLLKKAKPTTASITAGGLRSAF